MDPQAFTVCTCLMTSPLSTTAAHVLPSQATLRVSTSVLRFWATLPSALTSTAGTWRSVCRYLEKQQAQSASCWRLLDSSCHQLSSEDLCEPFRERTKPQ
ncbi:hypothetical protein MHYP_G00051380 [Metynnis hypsauchen]